MVGKALLAVGKALLAIRGTFKEVRLNERADLPRRRWIWLREALKTSEKRHTDAAGRLRRVIASMGRGTRGVYDSLGFRWVIVYRYLG